MTPPDTADATNPLEPGASLENAWTPPHERLSRIGRYLIIDEQGRGAMGLVYRALDPDLDRVVALKVLLLGSHASEQDRKRFLTEARVMATLKNPGIVEVLDSGVHHGCPYFAMEYIKGTTLRAHIEQTGALSVPVALRMLATIARAVHYAHEHGVIHRDIKPANLLLDDALQPRISDFGVARLLNEVEAGLTLTGQVLGTPAYMAPEQAAGDIEQIGPASDVYSLGAVFFHMLTGHPPPTGTDRHASAAPRIPSTLPVRLTDSVTTTDINTFFQKAVAADPIDRYATALELAEDAERILRGEPIRASRPSLKRRLIWQLRSHRALLLSLVATLMLSVGAVSGWQVLMNHREALVQAQREREAQAPLTELQQTLTHLWQEAESTKNPWILTESDPAEARTAQALETFLKLPAVRGTSAPSKALLFSGARALELEQLEPARDALARAYLEAHQPASQLETLLALSHFFRQTGDAVRLQALDRLLTQRLPALLEQPTLQEHRRASALMHRDIPRILQHLDAPKRARLEPFLQRFSRYHNTGQKWKVFGWNQRGRPWRRHGQTPGLPGSSEWIPAQKALGRPFPTPTMVDPPPGFHLIAPPIDLGQWQDAPLLGLTLQEEVAQHIVSGLYQWKAGRLTQVLALPAERLIAGCRGDLDQDGVEELYLSIYRGILRVPLTPNAPLKAEQADAPFRQHESDVQALFIADLEGDGRPELVASLSDWRAYDVRVFEISPLSGQLQLKARRKLGPLSDVVPFPLQDGRTGILALRHQFVRWPRTFPSWAPSGLPVGTYLLTLEGTGLAIKYRVPPPFVGTPLEQLLVGDFNGDGGTDFALTARVGAATGELQSRTQPYLQLALSRPNAPPTASLEEGFDDVLLAGLSGLSTLDADGDGASELAVLDEKSLSIELLGVGDEPLTSLPDAAFVTPGAPDASVDGASGVDAPVDVPVDDTVDVPVDATVEVDATSGVDAWQRMEDLLALHLRGAIADALRRINPTDNGRAANVLLHAGEVALSSGALSDAASFFEAAAAYAPSAEQAWQGAVSTHQKAWNRAEELKALTALLKVPSLSPSHRATAEARAAALRRSLTRPAVVHTFDTPLDANWKFQAPQWVRRDPQNPALVLRPLPLSGALASLPLVWDGGRLSLHLTLEVPRVEWGAACEILLRKKGTEDPAFVVSIDVWGGWFLLYQRVQFGYRRESPVRIWEQKLPQTQGLPIQVRLEYDPGSATLYAEVNGQSHAFSALSAPLPAAGEYELVFAPRANPPDAGAMLDIRLIRLELAGASRAPGSAEDPIDAAARWLVEGQPEAALQALSDPDQPLPLPLPDMSRAHLLHALALCALEPAEPCLKEVERLHRAGEAELPTLEALERALVRDNPEGIMPLLLRLRGRLALQIFATTWSLNDPGILDVLPSAMGALDWISMPPRQNPIDTFAEQRIRYWRARSFLARGAYSQARVELHRAAQAWDTGPRADAQDILSRVMSLYAAKVEHELAVLHTVLGQPTLAEQHTKRALQVDTSPELRAEEMLQQNPALAPLIPPEIRRWVTPVEAYRLSSLKR